MRSAFSGQRAAEVILGASRGEAFGGGGIDPCERDLGEPGRLGDHFASAHLAAWRSTWPTLGITERYLALYEIGDPQPI